MEIPDPRMRLRDLAAGRGDSLAALSAMLGRNAAYLQQFVMRGSPRILAAADRRRLADYFGVDEVELGAERRIAGFALPRLDVAASAGPGAFVDDEIVVGADVIDPALARRLGLKEGRAGIIRVRGTSMEPGLYDGDMIVVDLSRPAPGRDSGVRGEIHVIRVDGLTMVKRLRQSREGLTATSDNPAAPPVTGRIEPVGKVVWLMRAPR